MRGNLLVGALLISGCAVNHPPAETSAAVEAAGIAEADAALNVPAPVQPAIAYPATKRVDLIETQFGTAIADPYRWLEDDVRTNPDVRAWVDAQNGVTNAIQQHDCWPAACVRGRD